MQWLKQLVAGLSPWRLRFLPCLFHVGFVVDKGDIGRGFLQVIRSSPANIIPPWLSMLIYHLDSRGWTGGPLVASVQRRSLMPSTWKTTLLLHSHVSLLVVIVSPCVLQSHVILLVVSVSPYVLHSHLSLLVVTVYPCVLTITRYSAGCQSVSMCVTCTRYSAGC
jgi:hypothetical protein